MALVMGGIATATAAFLATLSFLVSHALIAENARIVFDFQAEVVARQLEFESRALERLLSTMASNTFVSNALVDSLGRDQYLLPFLRDQDFPGTWNGELWLVDFEGQPIAANDPHAKFDHHGAAALRAAISKGHSEVEMMHDDSLLLAIPVVFPPTGSIEGAVVAVASYRKLLSSVEPLLAQGTCIVLRMGGRELPIPAGCHQDGRPLELTRRLNLPPSFQPLNAELRLYVAPEAASVATHKLTIAYLSVVGTVVLVAFLISRRMSRRVLEPLARLTDTADSIVRLDRLDLRAPVVGSDEIARLARSFNKMVESLQAAQANLLDDIAQRRHAEEALRHLNRQLQMVSECKQALIQSKSESDLLQTVCTMFTEVGEYPGAWVGYAMSDRDGALRPVASAGIAQGELDSWKPIALDNGHGSYAEGVTVRAAQPCIVQNLPEDGRFERVRAQLAERGLVSLCALPMAVNQEIFGVLGVYSSRANAFDAGELVLLTELAGDLAFGISVLRTRSERERSDRALRESELLLRRSQEVGDLGSYYFDAVRGTWISSEKLDQIFGIDDSFTKTVSGWLQLVHPEERQDVSQLLTIHVLRRHNRFDREYRIVRWHDGQVRWVHGLGELEFDAQGEATKMIGTVQDITPRKEAEQALHASEARYRLLFDANPHPLWVHDAQSMAFLTVNDAAIAHYGYSRDEFLAMTVGDIREDDGRPSPFVADDLLNGRSDVVVAERHIKKDGTRIDVELISHTLSLSERPAKLVLVDDVTDRKRVEVELERYRRHLEEMVAERTMQVQQVNAELHEAMAHLVQAEKLAALGNLVAGVAHELNTPLGNARVVAGLLGEQLHEFAEAVASGSLRRSQVDAFLGKGREAVALIERNAARAADLIGHFKQVAVDQSSAWRRSFDLLQIVQDTVLTLQPNFRKTRHRVEIDIPAGIELDSYPGPLEQVITNLVSNALTHAFSDTQAGCIKIEANANPTQVVLRCADDGIGIPENNLKRIFEPFFTTRMGQGGSGLGLYIVYNLVTGILGGAIHVDSRPDQGASFVLTLPRVAPRAVASG